MLLEVLDRDSAICGLFEPPASEEIAHYCMHTRCSIICGAKTRISLLLCHDSVSAIIWVGILGSPCVSLTR